MAQKLQERQKSDKCKTQTQHKPQYIQHVHFISMFVASNNTEIGRVQNTISP